MKIAFYGNNLNLGYFFVEAFRDAGHDAVLLQFPSVKNQDDPEWWLEGETDATLMRRFGVMPDLGSLKSLSAQPVIQELYAYLKSFDAICMMQEGPAIFSELDHPNMLFISQGGDLQNLPFGLSQYFSLRTVMSVLTGKQVPRTAKVKQKYAAAEQLLRTVDRDDVALIERVKSGLAAMRLLARRGARQRAGLKRCRHWVCTPNQVPLIHKLGHSLENVTFMQLPYFLNPRPEIAPATDGPLIFFHPTRVLFLKLDDNIYLKNNHRLVRAFAQFIAESECEARLVMVRPACRSGCHPCADRRSGNYGEGRLGR